MRSRFLAIVAAVGLAFAAAIAPNPALADYPLIAVNGTSTPGNPVVLQNMSGQSTCTVEVQSITGNLTPQGIVLSTWANLIAKGTDGTTYPTISSSGTYLVNCAGFRSFQLISTGSAQVSVTASGGIGTIVGAGRIQTITGSGPVTATTTNGNTTVGLTSPLAVSYGGTGTSSLPSGCLQSNGSAVTSTGASCATPGPAATPVSVQPGNNVTVVTPSPGVFVVSAVTPTPAPTPNITAGPGISTSQAGSTYTITNTGVTGLVAGSNIVTPGVGPTPTVSVTQSPTFTGTVSSALLNASNLTANACLMADGSKNIVSLAGAFASGCQPSTTTNQTVTLPAAGSTFTMSTVTNFSYIQYGEIFRFISPTGSYNFDAALVSATGNTGNQTFEVLRYFAGAAGGTLPVGSILYAQGIANYAGTGISITSSGGNGPTITNTGVLSLTAGDSNAVIGGTAQAPTVTVTQAPTFAGPVTGQMFTATAGTGIAALTYSNTDTTTGKPHQSQIFAGGAGATVQGVAGACFNLANSNVGYLLAADCSGNFGAQSVSTGNMTDNALNASQCVTSNSTKMITSTGAACASRNVFDFPVGTFNGGTFPVATTNATPFAYIATLGYTLTSFAASCIAADNGNGVVSLRNFAGATVGTITFANGAYSASTTLNYTPTTPQQAGLFATVVTQGSATYCTFTVSGTRPLQ